MRALNVLFGNQVIQTNQFFFSALWPLTRRLSGGRIFFFGHSLLATYYQLSCQARRSRAKIIVDRHARSVYRLIPTIYEANDL
jgi:hypothetical protein